jgi:hypothetical protein
MRAIATDLSQLIPQCASKFPQMDGVGSGRVMLHYVKKFAMEIVPSVAATIIGAYIVNHYIAAKPAADAPAAAVVSTAKPKSKAESKADPKVEAKVDAKTETEAGPGGGPKADEQTDLAAIPASGVKAKGISEKAILEKNAAAEKGVVVEKPAEKVIDKPAETTASLPVEPRRQPQPPRERATAKLAPGPVQPVVATVPSESAAAQEERRDANDLARAAIERLRGSETPRAPEPARVQETPRASTAAAPPALGVVKPLPPPIVVAAPSENPDAAATRPPYAAPARSDDPASRPTPPGEIPTARPPLDLRAEMVAGAPRERTSVAEDMLSAAKTMFHAVLPK